MTDNWMRGECSWGRPEEHPDARAKRAKNKPKTPLPYHRLVVPESDGTFSARITEFPGCIATGDTAVDALANLEKVAESWLESAIAQGLQIPEPNPRQGKIWKNDYDR